MCGLFGVVSPATWQECSAFLDLMKVSSLRGPHSTGLLVSRRNKTFVYREAVNSVTFVESPEMADVLNPTRMYGDIYMGHCRYATVGKVTKSNAHPFRAGSIVAAHNGTLGSYKDKLEGKADITDSQVLIEEMASNGIIPTLSQLTSKDSYAVSIYDLRTKSLMLSRNHQRPLYLAVCDDTGTVFYSSEGGMLRFVLSRSNIDARILVVRPFVLISIDPRDIKPGNKEPWSAVEISEPKVEDNVSDKSPF